MGSLSTARIMYMQAGFGQLKPKICRIATQQAYNVTLISTSIQVLHRAQLISFDLPVSELLDFSPISCTAVINVRLRSKTREIFQG